MCLAEQNGSQHPPSQRNVCVHLALRVYQNRGMHFPDNHLCGLFFTLHSILFCNFPSFHYIQYKTGSLLSLSLLLLLVVEVIMY